MLVAIYGQLWEGQECFHPSPAGGEQWTLLTCLPSQLHCLKQPSWSLYLHCPGSSSRTSAWFLKWSSDPAAAAKSLQSCPTLCDPRDGSPPGSPVPGILQARTPQNPSHDLKQGGTSHGTECPLVERVANARHQVKIYSIFLSEQVKHRQ